MTPVHPLRNGSRFKLGLFGANADGGMMLTTAPERWRAGWDDLLALARLADEAGLEFMLPIARWKGYGGRADNLGWSFETLTQAAALGAATSRIGIFVTAHVPLVHPVFAAKALATIDHVTHGRLGLNIVCGWNQEEFGMFGVHTDADRYEQGLEWVDVLTRLFAGGPAFDVAGRFYQGQRLQSRPGPVQLPRPLVMSAGFSPAGQDFAARVADCLFTSISEADQTEDLARDVAAHAARYGRSLGLYTTFHVVCRPTLADAEAYYHYMAEEHADRGALEFHQEQRRRAQGSAAKVERPVLTRFSRGGKRYAGSYPGIYPMVGTPDSIAAEIAALHRRGVAGAALSFLNYLDELPFFAEEVLPRLERDQIRDPR